MCPNFGHEDLSGPKCIKHGSPQELFGGVPTTPDPNASAKFKYRDTNGRRIAIQIGGVYTTFCQGEGILLQKYRDRNGRCIAILLKSIGVRGPFGSPENFRRYLQGCYFKPHIAY